MPILSLRDPLGDDPFLPESTHLRRSEKSEGTRTVPEKRALAPLTATLLRGLTARARNRSQGGPGPTADRAGVDQLAAAVQHAGQPLQEVRLAGQLGRQGGRSARAGQEEPRRRPDHARHRRSAARTLTRHFVVSLRILRLMNCRTRTQRTQPHTHTHASMN